MTEISPEVLDAFNHRFDNRKPKPDCLREREKGGYVHTEPSCGGVVLIGGWHLPPWEAAGSDDMCCEILSCNKCGAEWRMCEYWV